MKNQVVRIGISKRGHVKQMKPDEERRKRTREKKRGRSHMILENSFSDF